MALLDELFSALQNGGQTPWAQEAMRRMLAGESISGADTVAPAKAMPLAPPMMNAPVGKVTSEQLPPVAQASGEPAGARSPGLRPMPPQGGTPAAAKPAATSRPDFSGSTGAGLLDTVVKAFGGEPAGSHNPNVAYDILTSRGMDPRMAEMAARDPRLFRSMIPGLVSAEKKAPQIIDVPGQYGAVNKMFWNPQTGQMEPISNLMGGSAQPSGGVPAPAVVAPTTQQVTTVPPPSGGAAPSAAAGPAPAASPATAPSQAAAAGDQIVGQAVPKPPEGYVHKLAPDGSGYLYSKAGQPIFESKAESDARARIGEKRSDTQREAEQQIGGISSIINDARKLTKAPGFDSALTLGRTSLNIGIPTPMGTIGGDVLTPAKQLARMFDSQNPAFGTSDAITSVQNQLNLLVARPLMKGQGQVSDSERKTISDAIGGLTQSSNAADYHFRLNNIQRMIEDMNTTGKVKPAAEYSSRPSADEIKGVINTSSNTFSQAGIDALAKKYNTSSSEMQKYVLDLDKRWRTPGDGAQSAPAAPAAAPAPALPDNEGRLAPDGKWYLPDPNRAGKWMRVN